jgi:hypothetical protein
MIVRKSKNQYRIELGKVLSKPYGPEDKHEVMEWCKEHFGTGGRNRHCKWRYGWVEKTSDYFYFKNEQDAMYFVLRWS